MDERRSIFRSPRRQAFCLILIGLMAYLFLLGPQGEARDVLIHALADIDENTLGNVMNDVKGKLKEGTPLPRTFVDYRKMFDECRKDIDVVLIATPARFCAAPDFPFGVEEKRLRARWCFGESPVRIVATDCVVRGTGAKVFRNSVPSRARASIRGEVGREWPQAPRWSARTVSRVIRRRLAGRGAGEQEPRAPRRRPPATAARRFDRARNGEDIRPP